MSIESPRAVRPMDRRDWIVLGLVTLAAALLRILLWKTQSIPSVDGTAYIRMAWALAGGPHVDSVHQYGYPLLIRLVQFVVPDGVTAARIVALVSGIAFIPALGWLTAAFVHDRRLRLLPAAAAAFTPLMVRYSLTTMTEMPYFVLLALGLGLAARRRGLAAGVALGAAYAIRPEGLLVAMAAAVLLWRHPREAVRLVAGAAILVLPYVVVLGVTEGKWTLTPKSLNIAAGTWEAAEERAGAGISARTMAERVERYGAETARMYPKHAADMLAQLGHHSGWLPMVAALPGLAGPAALLAAGLLQIVFLPLTFIGARVRYIVPFLPILWILSVVAVERIGRPALKWGAAGLLALSIALGAWNGRALYTMNEDGYFPELVEAGKWLRTLSTATTVVYDRKPYTAFYAGAVGRFTPAGDYDAILDEVVARGGDYLVVSEWQAERWRPALLPLARDARFIAAERRLVPIYFDVGSPGHRTLIYRIVRPGGPPAMPGEDEVRGGILQYLSTPAR
jgi:hypothetical protein